MIHLPRVEWKLLACKNGASPDCTIVVVYSHVDVSSSVIFRQYFTRSPDNCETFTFWWCLVLTILCIYLQVCSDFCFALSLCSFVLCLSHLLLAFLLFCCVVCRRLWYHTSRNLGVWLFPSPVPLLPHLPSSILHFSGLLVTPDDRPIPSLSHMFNFHSSRNFFLDAMSLHFHFFAFFCQWELKVRFLLTRGTTFKSPLFCLQVCFFCDHVWTRAKENNI